MKPSQSAKELHDSAATLFDVAAGVAGTMFLAFTLWGWFLGEMVVNEQRVRYPDDGDFVQQPHQILIFKRPLEEDFPDPKTLRMEIRRTVIHELAHHFGWSERDLDAFEAKDDPWPGADIP